MLRPVAFLSALLLTITAVSAAEVETFTIKTLTAQMRYDIAELTIRPGAQVKIIFENTDDMPHNIVFFQPGTDVVAVCNKQMEKPEEALKRNWLPEDPAMWLHSKMLNPKEKQEIVFKAPEKPGTYPFVCSFPGHAMTMQGKLQIAAPGPKLTDLKFAVYLGDWKKLPDFSKLTAHREGGLADGLVEIKLDDYKNQFGVVYTGKLKAPKDGEYTFAIAGDDGVRLSIDGKKVVEFDGIHPSREIKEGKVKLKEGEHEFRLEYFQAAGPAELYAAWSGPGFTRTSLSKWEHPNANTPAKKKDDEATGMPLVVEKEAIVYRNFITGAGNRSIAVGYPGGFNLAWNAESMNAVYLWRGAFVDAARHWKNRGGGAQPPLGFDVLRLYPDLAPAFAVLSAPDTAWPAEQKDQRPAGFQWKGYTLDAKRMPTFRYEWKGVKVSERFDTEGVALAGNGKLVRTLQLGGSIPDGAMFRVAAGNKVEATNGGFFVDGGRLTIGPTSYDNRFKVAVEGGVITGGNTLVVPARAQIKVSYTWLTAHAAHAGHSAHAQKH